MWSRTAGDKRGPAGRTGLLAVVVGEDRALVGDAVEVGRAIAHLAAVVGADVPVADILAHNDDDGRLGGRLRSGRLHRQAEKERHGPREGEALRLEQDMLSGSMEPDHQDRDRLKTFPRRAWLGASWRG